MRYEYKWLWHYQLAAPFNKGIEAATMLARRITRQYIVPIDFPRHGVYLCLELVVAIAKKRNDGHDDDGEAQN